MKHSRFSEERIIGILKEQESGMKTSDVCRRHGISEGTFYKWKSKYGDLQVSESENGQLKKLLAETILENAVLRDANSKKW